MRGALAPPKGEKMKSKKLASATEAHLLPVYADRTSDKISLIKPAIIERPTELITPAVLTNKNESEKKTCLITPAIFTDQNKNAKKSSHSPEFQSFINNCYLAECSNSVAKYIYDNNLPVNYVGMLESAMENSIGIADKISSYLPEFICDGSNGKIFIWNSEFWKEISKKEFSKKVVETLKNYIKINMENKSATDFMLKTGNAGFYKGVIETLLLKHNVDGNLMNSAQSVLCLKNGILNLRDFKLYSFEAFKYYYITFQIQHSYDPSVYSPVLNDFLYSIMGDSENVNFLQSIFGYALLGKPTLQKAFILEGSGSNGKSTLISAIQFLLKDLTGTLPVSYFTGSNPEDPNRPSPATYNIKGKHLIFTSEAEASSYLNENRVKKFIGGGTLIARPPYGQLVEFENNATLFFDTNHLPHFKSGGFSMERRLVVVPFPFTFTKESANPNLPELLKKQEAQTALLAWLIHGARNVSKNGFIPTTRVTNATKAFFKSEDTIGQFIEDMTINDPEYLTPFKTLYEAYRDYCNQNCLEAKTSDVFAKSEKIKNLPTVKKNVRFKKGIRIKTPV